MVTYESVCDKMECTIEKFVDMAKTYAANVSTEDDSWTSPTSKLNDEELQFVIDYIAEHDLG